MEGGFLNEEVWTSNTQKQRDSRMTEETGRIEPNITCDCLHAVELSQLKVSQSRQ